MTNNYQPDLIFGGLRLGEPVIALTSLLMAFVCIFAWLRLQKSATVHPEIIYFRLFFLLMGISAILGSVVGHLFLYMLPFALKVPGWMLGMFALAALVQASIYRTARIGNGGYTQKLSWLNSLSLIAASLWLIGALWFPIVEFHAAFGLLMLILPMEWSLFQKDANETSKYMLWGIGLLVSAVLFHIGKISFGVWFSFFDIAHLIMCGAFWCFLLGAEATISTTVQKS